MKVKGRTTYTQFIGLLVIMILSFLNASCTVAINPDGKPGTQLDTRQSSDNSVNIVALQSDGALPDVDIEKLVANDKRTGGGALEGAGNGVAACANAFGGYSSLSGLAFLVCAPFTAVGGAVSGAAKSEPNDPRDWIYTNMIGELKRKRLSASKDLMAALEKYAALNGIPTISVQANRSVVGSESAPISRQEARTLLDVKVVRLFFVRAKRNNGISDGIGIEARIRVLRLPERKIIDSYSFVSYPTTEGQTFDERSNDDRLEHAYLEVARTAFDESILAYRGGPDAFVSGGPVSDVSRGPQENKSVALFPNYTLRPIYPQHTNNSLYWQKSSGLGGQASVVDTLQPEFQWESLPVGFGIDSTSKIRNITYEFNLYPGRPFGRGYLPREDRVYVRTGLTLPTHSLEAPLVPCTHYFWSVRAHFTLDGQPRVTEWSGAYAGVHNAKGAITASSYRRTGNTLSEGWMPIGVFYPEFRTQGECGTSSNTDIPTIRLKK